LYVAVMLVVFVIFFRDRNLLGAVTGLVISGPLYVGLGSILAKLGYQRKTLRQLRSESASPRSSKPSQPQTTAAQSRPAPTKRTSSGPSNRPNRSRRPRR